MDHRVNDWWQQYSSEKKKGEKKKIVNIEDHLSNVISNRPTIINTSYPNFSKEHRWGPHLFYPRSSGGKKRCRTRTCKPKGKPAKSRTSSSSSASSRKMRMRRSSAHRNRK